MKWDRTKTFKSLISRYQVSESTGPETSAEPSLEIAHFAEEVSPALENERVDRLVCLVADVSRNRATELIGQSRVLVDGVVATKGSRRLPEGVTIEISVPAVNNELVGDVNVEIPVVYEDADVIVINKPIGLVVHPGSGVTDKTMVNGLLAKYPEIGDVGQVGRPGIVHRLDKDTSGLLMVARTEEAYVDLVDQLKARLVGREYAALAFGAFDSESGTIDAPLGRSQKDATRQAVVMDGRKAITHYEVEDTYRLPKANQIAGPSGKPRVVTRLRCQLETGRTHQIRVHLSSIGRPIVGDQKYGGGTTLLSRPFLHAASLAFTHPSTGESLSFEAPLPEDLSALLTSLDNIEQS